LKFEVHDSFRFKIKSKRERVFYIVSCFSVDKATSGESSTKSGKRRLFIHEGYNHENKSKGDVCMKTGLHIVGALLILVGSVWVLQGVNILPGSFMTGQIQWAINGAIAIALGIAVILFARRRK